MRHRALTNMLALCAFATLPASAGDKDVAVGITYQNAERTFLQRFVDDPERKDGVAWWTGQIIPPRPPAPGSNLVTDTTTDLLHDCSDRSYRCVRGWHVVFAVPRAGLRPDATYEAGGAAFKVEECLRGEGERCQVALVSSDCQSMVEPDACAVVEGGRVASAAPGQIAYFLYNDDFGVTAFGSAKQPPDTPALRKVAALEMLLGSDIGLLFAAKDGADSILFPDAPPKARPVGTTSKDFDFSRNGPKELLAYLQSPDALAKEARRLRIDRAMIDWISEDDIPYLVSQLDSSAPCLSVYLPTSARLLDRVTVGDMAAYLIDSYRSRIFPMSNHSGPYTKGQRDEIRGWWQRYSDARRLPYG